MFNNISVAFILLAVVAGGRTLLADGHHKEQESLYVSSNLPNVTNSKWKTECASCHMLFLPSLLPARSWIKMMGGLEKHFGENASLDAKTKDEITKFLVANSAEVSSSRRGAKINRSIPSESTPLRITETPYFLHKHDEISLSVWKRPKVKSAANCVACHRNAERGVFSEHEVSIPR